MSHLTVHFDFMALIYSHQAGLTALLPSSGHDATLLVGAVPFELRSANVTMERDGAIMSGTGPIVRRGGGLLHLSEVMEFVDESQRTDHAIPRNELLTQPVERWREISARIILPGGTIETSVRPGPVQPPSQYAFRRDGKKDLPVGMDRVTFTMPLDPRSQYRLRIDDLNGPRFVGVAGGTVITIANADRPTRNTKPYPWFEFVHLLDLLDLKKLEYPFPTPPTAKAAEPMGPPPVTPDNDPCGSLLCGTFIRE